MLKYRQKSFLKLTKRRYTTIKSIIADNYHLPNSITSKFRQKCQNQGSYLLGS